MAWLGLMLMWVLLSMSDCWRWRRIHRRGSWLRLSGFANSLACIVYKYIYYKCIHVWLYVQCNAPQLYSVQTRWKPGGGFNSIACLGTRQINCNARNADSTWQPAVCGWRSGWLNVSAQSGFAVWLDVQRVLRTSRYVCTTLDIIISHVYAHTMVLEGNGLLC